jgi:hypothetical protein
VLGQDVWREGDSVAGQCRQKVVLVCGHDLIRVGTRLKHGQVVVEEGSDLRGIAAGARRVDGVALELPALPAWPRASRCQADDCAEDSQR